MNRRGSWEDEHGFTLIEVLATIVLMGIVFGIATSTWFGVIESRRVDSATNQLKADLRLAHTTATTRMTPWLVTLPTDPDPDDDVYVYSIGREGDPDPPSPTLEGARIVGTPVAIRFKTDGGAERTSGSGTTIRVEATNDADRFHEIEFNMTTSRVRVCPATC